MWREPSSHSRSAGWSEHMRNGPRRPTSVLTEGPRGRALFRPNARPALAGLIGRLVQHIDLPNTPTRFRNRADQPTSTCEMQWRKCRYATSLLEVRNFLARGTQLPCSPLRTACLLQLIKLHAKTLVQYLKHTARPARRDVQTCLAWLKVCKWSTDHRPTSA